MNKRKLFFAVIALLLCLTVFLSASFAWFSITRAPEITGVNTYIGSNGNLELALLSDTTYVNPASIRSKIGDSVAVQEVTESNLAWGNVLDLSDESYGLDRITMIPSRLNTVPGENGRTVLCSNALIVPKFGIDGRFSEFETSTVSAVFADGEFSYMTGSQSYGVRGVGSISGLTLQQSALAGARTKVRAYQAASLSTTAAAWTSCGGSYLEILYRHHRLQETVFNDSDLAVLRDMATQMLSAANYLDLALRQAVVGYAASYIQDEDTFRMLRENVENTVIPLSLIVKQADAALPQGLEKLIAQAENDKLDMSKAIAVCDALAAETRLGGKYVWDSVYPITLLLIKDDEAYLGEKPLNNPAAYAAMSQDNVLTLSPDAGIMAHIADYSGNYQVLFSCTPTDAQEAISTEVATTSLAVPSHLETLSALLEDCTAASGNLTASKVDLNDAFGYIVDMAFRCNERSNLLLQTAPESRIDNGSQPTSTQGGGSYMRFQSEQLTAEQIVLMMDAIRIGFLDHQNNLIAIAKLNTSNYQESEGVISAPLYLYDYAVRVDGSVSTGERLPEQSHLTELPKGTAVVMSVIVWLDGDYVDNSLAGVSSQSMTGSLNLQFSSTVNLTPSGQSIKK